ncbi:hypothetical protein C8J57DRAFT_1514478 [Mycena rebaudengoi]|nr:hypothetical protein C8J57DRAFT_1514478 [Mycena rebaudengoi]
MCTSTLSASRKRTLEFARASPFAFPIAAMPPPQLASDPRPPPPPTLGYAPKSSGCRGYSTRTGHPASAARRGTASASPANPPSPSSPRATTPPRHTHTRSLSPTTPSYSLHGSPASKKAAAAPRTSPFPAAASGSRPPALREIRAPTVPPPQKELQQRFVRPHSRRRHQAPVRPLPRVVRLREIRASTRFF